MLKARALAEYASERKLSFMLHTKKKVNSKKYCVNAPVTDLRKNPIPYQMKEMKDPLQESQLIFGEKVIGIEEFNGWILVEAIEQKRWNEQRGWHGYPGWVKKEHLTKVKNFPKENLIIKLPWVPIYYEKIDAAKPQLFLNLGTRLVGIRSSEDFWEVSLGSHKRGFVREKDLLMIGNETTPCLNREEIILTGKKLLGDPYLWGGRSSYTKKFTSIVTGYDCSGFVNILYRTQGLDIPRDAHDQFLASHRIEPEKILPGDLVFTASHNGVSSRMDHVMMYIGNGQLMEATMLTGNIVITQIESRLGNKLSNLRNGMQSKGFTTFFGSFFS